jgi:hypothetical protein
LQKELGGYRKELPHSGDLEMWLRFAAHSSVGRIHAVQGIHRIHKKNMSDSYFDSYIENFQQIESAYDFFFGHYGSLIPDSRALRAQAERVLAAQAFWTAVQKFCHGNRTLSRQLFDFCFGLCPSYRFWPPWAYLARVKSIERKVTMAFLSLFGRMGGRLFGR